MPRSLIHRGLTALLIATMLAAPAAAQVAAEPATDFGAQTGGNKTIAVVALSGYQPLFDDVDYISNLIGRPDGAQAIQGMIALFTQGRGLQGLDQSRPWGVVVEANGVEFRPIICLPIDDLDSILQLAQGFGVAADDAGGGVTELSVPNSPAPLFVKPVGPWVYVSQTAESLDDAPEDPTPLFQDLIAEYDLGARVLAQNVPVLYRQMAIDGLRQGIEEGLEQEPDETDEQFAARKELTETQFEQILMFIEDLDTLTVGVAVNESAGPGLVVDVELAAIPNSDLAAQLSAMRDATTTFAGFLDDRATIAANISVESPPEVLAKQLEQNKAGMKILRKQMLDAIEQEAEVPSEEAREVLKSAANDLFDAYEATALAGKVDAAAAVSVSGDSLTIIGGAVMKSTDKVESALKKLSGLIDEVPEVPPVKWDAESHDGVSFHTLSIPVPDDEPEVQAMLGPTLDVAVGIGPERVYLAVGPESFAALTSAMDESKAKGATPVKPLQVSMSLKSLADFALAFAEGNDAAGVQMLVDALKDVGSDDHFRLILESTDNGFRYRIVAEEGVIKAFASIAEQGARQAGAAPRF